MGGCRLFLVRDHGQLPGCGTRLGRHGTRAAILNRAAVSDGDIIEDGNTWKLWNVFQKSGYLKAIKTQKIIG